MDQEQIEVVRRGLPPASAACLRWLEGRPTCCCRVVADPSTHDLRVYDTYWEEGVRVVDLWGRCSGCGKTLVAVVPEKGLVDA